eukprot:TRINITY_DN496_c0_g1_i10.p1 TRINITY_DN496_c0_g1~~TRINITY_DN496_c0_g1_i10.p1  ORF type:complete len:206 (-),score=34.40 TRINITY_DN496_c0_g1_i10:29-646(-)
MEWRNSNSESRSSAGQFSIGSLRMSDVRLSLPNREENGEEETQNPFEQTAQTSPVEKETHTIMKGCNCKKTQCLRGYCECFIRKEMCTTDCNCIGCHNTRENAEEVNATRERLRVKYASRARIGCNCNKTLCVRNYCSCYRNGQECGESCKCMGCVNKNEITTSEHKTSMSEGKKLFDIECNLSLIHICRCRRYAVCRSRWSPYH